MIEKNKGVKVNLTNLKLNDPKVFELISKGETFGVFQLESEGMKKLLMRMKVDCFDDIVAANALFRPGPMEHIPAYIARKHKQEKIESLDPSIDPILKSTYGIMIYQEQIMQVAKVFASFSLGKADMIRKAVSKKGSDLMMSMEQDFINGAMKNGHSKELSIKVFEQIKKFAGYGFNKSHSVAYAMVAYYMAYLKTYYPLEFFGALISSESSSDSSKLAFIQEGSRYGVSLLPPSINKSTNRFEVEGDNIRYALTAIKNVGISAYQEIISVRDQPFTDLYDFFRRIETTKINKKALENLIRAGALDEFDYDRKMMEENIDQLLEYAHLANSLGIDDKPILKVMHDQKYVKLEEEKEVLGIYLSKHPIVLYKEKYQGNYFNLYQLNSMINKNVVVIACVERIRLHKDKRGNTMAFITIYDESMKIDSVMFSSTYEIYASELKKNTVYLIEGKVTMGNNLSITIQQIKKIIGE